MYDAMAKICRSEIIVKVMTMNLENTMMRKPDDAEFEKRNRTPREKSSLHEAGRA